MFTLFILVQTFKQNVLHGRIKYRLPVVKTALSIAGVAIATIEHVIIQICHKFLFFTKGASPSIAVAFSNRETNS